MSGFRQTHFVTFSAMLLAFGFSTAWADADEGEKQADAQPVTSETRRQIVEHLLEVVCDVEENDNVRASAARSLGTQASNDETIQEKRHEALLEVVKAEKTDARVKIAAIEALRESEVKLTEDDLTTIGQALWTILAENDGSNDQERFLRAVSAREIAQYIDSNKPISGPKRIESVQALLEMSVDSDRFRVSSENGSISSSRLADFALATLTESEDGVRVLIEVLADLDGKFDAKREKIASLITHTVPKTEGIAQILLKAASHANPNVRAAAIEALGNEIPISDEGGMRPAESTSPAAPAGSS